MRIIELGLVTLFALGIVSSAHAQFKLPKLIWSPNPSGKDNAAKSVNAVQARLYKSILAIGPARKTMLVAQLILAESLGLKQEADDILSNARVLGEGGVARQPKDVAEIENSVKASEELNKILATAAAQAAPLDEKGKKLFLQGKRIFGKGLLAEAAQLTVLAAMSVELKELVRKAVSDPNQAQKIAVVALPAAKLAMLIPGDVNEMSNTWTLIGQIGAKNNIQVEEIDVSKYTSGPGAR